MKYDLIIVGAGPSGIFTALELNRENSNKKIMIVEQGKAIEKRNCPKDITKNVSAVNLIAILQRALREQVHFLTASCL